MLLITSTREGDPLVAKEAAWCGCPVVSVDVGDVSEWLEKNRCNAASIADGIEEVMTVEEARGYSSSEFSFLMAYLNNAEKPAGITAVSSTKPIDTSGKKISGRETYYC